MDKYIEKIFANKYLLIAILVIPAFLLYFKHLRFDFTALDDRWLIMENENLKTGWKGFKKVWKEAISGTYYRPFLTGSFFIDYWMGRLSPFSYHLNNLLMHLACVVLLYRFLTLNKVERQLALALSLLFSVHPIALHATSWIPGRNDLLLCLFTLSSLNLLIRYLISSRIKYLLLHFLFFTAALFSKESAVVLPFIYAFTILLYKLDGGDSFLYLIGAWVGVSMGWFFLRESIVVVQPDIGLSATFFKNVVPGFLLFTGKSILPLEQAVLPTLKSSTIVPGIITVIGLVVLIFKPGVRDKMRAFCGLFMFFLLLAIPVWYSASKSGAEFYEHRMYTSMAGMILFISQLKINWHSMEVRVAGALLFCLFTVRTYDRMDVYQNMDSFINAGAEETPDFYLFAFQKSGILFKEAKYDSALIYVERALSMRQDRPEMFTNRGSILYMQGHYKEAAESFNKAISIEKKFDVGMYLNRGFAYIKAGELDLAKRDLDTLQKCCQAQIPADFEKEVMKALARRDSLK